MSGASPSTPTSDFELDASPAKNTRSHKRTAVSPTPVLESPTKKRRTKADFIDLDVWDKADDEIINASKARWNSTAYDHFKISLHRCLKADGSPDYLEFKFTCHTDPVNHKPHHRKRMQTSQGTKNLNRGIKECVQRRGVSTEGPNAKGAQQTLSGSISKYTPEAHRALIAMRCAVNKRPFRSVADPLYIEEVRLLRPDVIVPVKTSRLNQGLESVTYMLLKRDTTQQCSTSSRLQTGKSLIKGQRDAFWVGRHASM